ncbi:MAG TPA: radical SAM protein [Candidatus Onthomonas avicola]|nr:radical SAM protein [Candidatus Onthomonas avicola]
MSADFEPACRRMEWLDPFYKQVWEKAFADGIPISGTFELTPRCNFNCKMCYVHLKAEDIPKHGREMTAKEWLRIAEEAREAGTTWVCVTGGEPLLHPEFPEIWRNLAQMGFFLTLQTNASLIRGEMAELLEQYPPRQAKITLYGTTDEVYRAVCGVEHGFTRVNDGIHTLMSMGIPVELVSTVIRQNQDDLPNMAHYAARHRLKWIPTMSIKPSLRGAEVDVEAVKAHLPPEVAERNRQQREEWRKKHPFDPERKPATYCRDYRLGYWVTWDGMMRFCSFMSEPNIPVREITFTEAWRQLLDYEEELKWSEAYKRNSLTIESAHCAASLNFVIDGGNKNECIRNI